MLVSWVKKLFTKRSFYEGAKFNTQNRDFYRSTTQDFEELVRFDRKVLRARARWLHENNAIMSNIDNTILNNVIGMGITLQSKTGNKRVDDEIEKKFKEWSKHCDITNRLHFNDLQRVILGNRMVDGEIFVYKRVVNDKKYPFKLQLIESDFVDESQGINGVELDNFGAVKGYYFQNKNSINSIFVKSEDIVNYCRIERPTQYRGISEYKQSIMDLKNFMAFNSALIAAVRARANIAYVVKSASDMKSYIDEEEYEQLQTINGLSVFYLNKGEAIEKLDPDIVSGEYKPFVESVIRMLSSARNISYELAYRDFSKVNFSSARASIIQDNKRFDNEQSHLIDYVLNPIFNEWLEVNVMSGNFKSIKPHIFINNREKYIKPVWITPAREWVDPLKDIKAIQTELELGLTTLSEVLGKKGKDLEEVLIQRQKEQELLNKYNLNSTTNEGKK